MTTLRIPLVGLANQRSIDGTNPITLGQDQRFVNCIFSTVTNPITGKSIFYLEKRPGFSINSLVSAGNISTGIIKTDTMGTVVSGFGATNTTIFDTQTNVGAITGEALHFSETQLSTTGFVMIRSSDGTGWYYASDSAAQITYTGKVTAGGTQVDGITAGTGTAGMYSGQLVASANIAAGSRISVVLSTTQLTLNLAATGSATEAITKTPIAKILSANFIAAVTNVSAFVEMDGFQFYLADSGILNSDLNTVHLYTASNVIAANMAPDLPVAIARHKNHIICFGTNSTEFFYNAGNATGSPLSRAEQFFQRVGIQNQRSLVTLEDDIYFISSSRTGDIHVKLLRNYQISQISTPAVDRILGTGNATGSSMFLSAFTLGGYQYLLVQVLSSSAAVTTNSFLQQESAFNLLLESATDKIILDANTSSSTGLTRELVYNIDLKVWSEWDSSLLTFVRGLGSGSTNQLVASSRLSTSGYVYGINPSSDTEVYADAGVPYTMTIQTSAPDFGTDKKKFIRSVTLIGDIQTSGTATLEKSDDDYKTWQTLGTFDLTAKEQKITRCGSHKGERAYRVTHTANSAFRSQALEIVYDVGEA